MTLSREIEPFYFESRHWEILSLEAMGQRFSPVWLPSIADKGDASGKCATIPLWIPFATLAAPTAWLWGRDRRIKSGCQKCGYPRDGLMAEAVCPECGAAECAAGGAAQP